MTARYDCTSSPLPEKGRLSAFDPGLVDIYRSGRIATLVDAEDLQTESLRAAYLTIDIRSWALVPLVKDGRFLAGIGIQCSERREWTETELQILKDVAERTWDAVERAKAEEALRKSESRLAQDLADAKLLQKFSNEIIHFDELGKTYNILLQTAMKLMRSDFASIQLYSPQTETLTLLAQENFHPESAKFWTNVYAGKGSVCGEALLNKTRIVISDIETENFPKDELKIFHLSGIRAVQSTPIKSSNGKLIGMLSTQWKQPRNFSEEEFRFFDMLVRQAADFIERKQAEEALKKNEEKYRSLFNSIDEGFCVLELVYDNEHNIVDLVFLEHNPSFFKHTGLENVIGKSLKKILPNYEKFWMDKYKQVAETGEPIRVENYAQDVNRWYNTYFLRIGDHGSRIVATVFEDITERKKAEEGLRNSEARFRRMFTNNMVPMFMWTPEGQTTNANEAFLNLIGYTIDEMREGKCNWNILTPPGYEDRDAAAVAEVMDKGYCEPYEKIFRHKEGHLVPFLVGGGVLEYENFAGVCYAIDLTERKKSEEALLESEARLAALIEAVPTAIGVVDLNGKVVVSNPLMKYFLPGNIIPSRDKASISRWASWDVNGAPIEPFNFPSARALRGERVAPGMEMLYTTEDGNRIWTQVSSVPLQNDKGEITGTVSAITNINELKLSAEALKVSEQRLKEFNESLERLVEDRTAELINLRLSQQKEILNAVLNAQEDERKRIAESLHNGLGQLLYAVKIKSEILKPDPNLTDQLALKNEIDKLLEETIDITRDISKQLSPQLLEEFGLKEAILSIADKFKSNDFKIEVKFAGNKNRLEYEIEIGVFRIVQELVNNIIKHSKATFAKIQIEIDQSELGIIAEDNGIGFKKSGTQIGMGLKMIENRVKLFNGTMKIESTPKVCTKISITLPF